MSKGDSVPAAYARKYAIELVNELSPLCEDIQIAGSLRREKEQIGDVEIVARPSHVGRFWALVDGWVNTGRVSKALYGASNRWGEKYRGIIFHDIRFEIFLGDAINWGYQLALRTGPTEANTYVMQLRAYHNVPFHADDGYWWVEGRKIAVPDEAEMFRLWGFDRVPAPSERTLVLYQRTMRRSRWATTWTFAEEAKPTITQESLF